MFKNASLQAFTLAEGATHVGVSHKNRRVAFTLAEVLITLGIIGVVAVLTLPNLMSDYRKKTYVAQLQRAYNQISNAVENFMMDEKVDNLADSSFLDMTKYENEDGEDAYSSTGLSNFLKKYFRITKDCGSEPAGCFAESYSSLDKTSSDTFVSLTDWYAEDFACATLNTGSSICLKHNRLSPMAIVDVNGKGGPNVIGRDIFMFYIRLNGSIDGGTTSGDDWVRRDCVEANGVTNLDEQTCTAYIMSNGWKMDY